MRRNTLILLNAILLQQASTQNVKVNERDDAGLDDEDCSLDDVADVLLSKMIGNMVQMPAHNSNMDETLLAKPGTIAARSPVISARPVMPTMSRPVSTAAAVKGPDVTVPVYDQTKKSVGEVTLDGGVFGLEPRKDILHQHVKYLMALRRAGTACTKTRSEVKTSKKKILAQKGSGNARKGSKNSPTMRGGGVAFGPKPKDWSFKLTKKVKALGLRHALSAAQKDGKLAIVDKVDSDGKTKGTAEKLKNFGAGKFLVVDGEKKDDMFARSIGNIEGAKYKQAPVINVYDLLLANHVLMTKDGVDFYTKRFNPE
eukprot:gnl/MRDRNA2_/MRDRNA2_79006_c0_seq1.p1 gnl/MRDRNA2_/MRDRNA2_79006_c0~~gnl/MRDRNA2_/MRDRNA2_79006_c0_seq1.p1  ORF type:complete len:313 (+),score=75.49 gnl/MRDRNA2_/MRDRNA2_79006_c0_seq1:140-1078(+)